jgi:predicted small secreted protein
MISFRFISKFCMNTAGCNTVKSSPDVKSASSTGSLAA